MQLEGKRIVVTGGASGMGAASVKAFAREGARVVALDVADDLGEAVAAEAAAEGAGTAAFLHCDVAWRAEVDDAFARAVGQLGGLDVVATAAGIWRGGPAETLVGDEAWEQVLAVNLLGTVYANQAAFAPMREGGGGRIVNFASSAGIVGNAGAAAYSASKGAVLAWTRAIATEWAPHGIRANAVVPAIWTPMYEYRRAQLGPEELAARDEATARRILLGGKLGDPDLDFAPVMVFLASEAARFITGQTLPVDGGATFLT